ncbi:TPA: peptidoglycan-binding protein [Escherichia coli]|nr:spore cortex-lytic protein [Escherichia coli]HAY3898340.1 spore cortex-lytic protein [Escherichia coli]HAY3977740.1 spore cortex-lytic protein [Escherichia coli]HBB9212001.1 peptidoglycan-binding protein [Escherichia coli]
MGRGFIKVELFTAREVLPVSGGNIFILKSTSVDFDKGHILTTDSSGITKILEVDTPDIELSKNKDSDQIPYSVYDLYVRAPGYKDAVVEGVQVFSNEVSIQQIEMIPTTKEREFLEELEHNYIPPHQLIEEMPRVQVDEKEPIFQSKVLIRPYIPEFITVHLGVPSSYAENVTVRFPEYIKNVASSEIYPTWPEHAIRANIYCQISFALNRVYTEWYRNKGYNFHITNSTAYDQYFIKGRNIFENISRIVDDIFNEYITREGYMEPLLAQYCNGTTVTCKGLSQWDTVKLATDGYETMEILKNYYGDNIELTKTNDIRGIEESFGGTPLKLNTTGSDVETIQRQINRISNNYPAIPKIEPVDGVFGSETESSVKAFQRIFNLYADGIVGKSTWYKISGIYVGVKRLAELESEGEKLESAGEYPGYLLKQGSTGDAVSQMQYFLNFLSQYYKEVPPINGDSIFGVSTLDSVIQFQKKFGLDVDGIVGKQTWNKIYSVYKDIINGSNKPEGDGYEYPGYILKQGSRGNVISKLQTYLSAIADKYPSIKNINVDGIFGKATNQAVIDFQKCFELNSDGIVGPLTWEKIVQVYQDI